MTALKTLQIEILNPKAERLIDDLAEMDLIRIDQKKESALERFRHWSDRLEARRMALGLPEEPMSMEEIVAEVKAVRAERYAEEQANKDRC